MSPNHPTKHEIKLAKERETKNTIRYQPVGDPEGQPVSTIYVNKTAEGFGSGGPEKIKLTIEVL